MDDSARRPTIEYHEGVGVIGELYERALAGRMRPEVEHADGSRRPLPVDGWLQESPGDRSLLDRCEGPTLDIGSGPGRLTVALAERGIPALGIDITPYAVDLARSSGRPGHAAGRVRPGPGHRPVDDGAAGRREHRDRRRSGRAAAPGRRAARARRARALVELEPPGSPLRQEQVRLLPRGPGQRVVPLGLRRRRPDRATWPATPGWAKPRPGRSDGRWFAAIDVGPGFARTGRDVRRYECLRVRACS